jgi:hypothetical protein
VAKLFNRIKKCQYRSQYQEASVALVPTSEDFAELRQCLPPDGMAAVKEYFDLVSYRSAESSVIQPPD